MTVDRGARKSAKKQWKRHAKAAEAKAKENKESAPKRIRKKSNVKRRLCKGLCYQDPAIAISSLTEADRQWGGNSDDEDQQVGGHDHDVFEGQAAAAERIESSKHATTSGAPESKGQQGMHKGAATPKAAAVAKLKKKSDKDPASGSPDGQPALRLSSGVHLLAQQSPGGDVTAAAPSAKHRTAVPVASAPALQPFAPLIQSFMASQGFVEPTPIQEQCWPAGCEGRDVQGVAEPGSGKTLAYLLPAFVRLKEAGHEASSQPDGPLLLVLAPTRELAMQVAQQCRHLRTLTGFRTACVYGGVPREQQEELLAKKPHVVVATPGRLLDLLDAGKTSLSQVTCVVLDEADKMLSLGFQPQLDRLHQLLGLNAPAAKQPQQQDELAAPPLKKGKKRQSAAAEGGTPAAAAANAAGAVAAGSERPRPQVLLFTATMPPEVAGAVGRWLRRPVEVTATHSAASISRTITQVVQVCAEHKKPAKLLRHLAAVKATGAAMRNPPRILVFTNRIKTVRFLHDTVTKEGYRVVMLHGQRSQAERDDAMKAFRSGKSQVMIATDVAARGLDIRALPYVVNYDFPSRLETYIHRVGRTGRLAANGHAFSFFTRNLAKLAGPLVELLRQHDQVVDPNLVQLADAWREAVERAGGEQALEAQLNKMKGKGGDDGEEEDEEEESQEQLEALMQQRLEAADVMEGLRSAGVLPSLLGAKQKGKKQPRQGDEGAADAAGAGVEPKAKRAKGQQQQADEAAAGPGPQSMQQRLSKAKAAGAAEALGREQSAPSASGLAFVPAQKFEGARPGYIFKLGGLGLGYYSDKPRAVRKPAAALQQQQRGKGPIIPIGPQGKGKFAWSDDEDEDGDGEAAAAPHAAAQESESRGQGKHRPGRLARGGQRPAADGGGDKHEGKGRKKALPGRLRKKLKAQKSS